MNEGNFFLLIRIAIGISVSLAITDAEKHELIAEYGEGNIEFQKAIHAAMF
ncbi:hypothetical protein [Paenibacillus sp. R14(2021)]|uniref:hypothetical protein n=1 Tax=Paenibacillus sp. R14(2021) TaxID=2859228 RepID=UPI001C6123A3|nr:hypothetical protein [Paenibacillus sp. R14(2021)]